MMREDLESWKTGDLTEIERMMNEVNKRLTLKDINKATQDKQVEIVKKLDKLIEEAEENQNKSKSESESGKGDGKEAKTNSRPATDSKIMGGNGKGEVDEKKLRYLAENWGALTPAERQRVTQEVSQNLPPKYKPYIDEYFKSLNRYVRP